MNALVRKLNAYTRLSSEDEQLVDRVLNHRPRTYPAHAEIAGEGEKPDAIRVFLDGWGSRIHTLEDGRRQILALYLPGDICDLDVLLAGRHDHAILTVTLSRVGEIGPHEHDELMAAHPRVPQALAWERFVASAIQREWAISLGQRTAMERIAHLMCEIFVRLKLVGKTSGTECDFPLTQTELGEAMGLSTVHVNRTLQALRSANLIALRDRTLSIPDFDALAGVAMFDAAYLHHDHEGGHLDANA